MSGRTIGYARTATAADDITPQIEALREAGCEEVYTDPGLSGASVERPGLNRLLGELRQEDEVRVVSIDRLSRSVTGLMELGQTIRSKGASLTLLEAAE